MIETFIISAILIAVFAIGYLVGNARASRSESPEIDESMYRKGW
jgi:hypothetical protein